MKRNTRMMMANPLCVRCKPNGRTSVVEEWDHIIPLYAGGKDEESNIQGLCRECHVIKTNEDASKYGPCPGR